MTLSQIFFCAFLVCIFSSFSSTQACNHVGSNITFVQKETEKALKNEDLQVMRFHIYKALGAISKSDKHLADCDCDDVSESLGEVAAILKNATITRTLASGRILLERSLEEIAFALEAIREHNKHDGIYGKESFTMNFGSMTETLRAPSAGKLFREKIDIALKNYRLSLQKVINTVNCKEARAFALNIYEKCDQQLLQNDLSEGKKYYNLRTKEITSDALKMLDYCE